MKNNFVKTMPIILGCLLMLTACNNSNEIQDSGSSDTIVNSTGGSFESSGTGMENSGNSADNSNPESSSTNETGTGSSQGDSQGNSSNDSSSSTTVSNSSSSTTENSVPESKPTMETPNSSSDVITGMRAIIAIDGVEYGMTITDTTIGRAFAEKLRDEGGYTVTGYRAADDICCSEEESLETDSSENIPWVCGGIAWTGTWFTVWVSEEAAGRDMPVIAQIDEEHLEELQKVSGSMEIEVRLTAE